ncbi:hypothetical protein [Limnofasciculus baicalensis]|uniref:Uncharacterized protein n=1 Tax=Limnofasciculus baicalensis BBK-W-15 TaxID=2699891 RepID=A0AAE3GSI0_9CYAN|nr:hypothetical protein [Limnofasciculus baicalensis]MCP2729018.1 hypothetical protein [Limnofasciculus baicalensis BBK-W-15]
MSSRKRIERKNPWQPTPAPDILQSRPFSNGLGPRESKLPTTNDILQTRPFSPRDQDVSIPKDTRSFEEKMIGAEFRYNGVSIPAFAPSTESPTLQREEEVGEDVQEDQRLLEVGGEVLQRDESSGNKKTQKKLNPKTEPGEIYIRHWIEQPLGFLFIPDLKNGQWYDIDREYDIPKNPQQSFWKAAVYNTTNNNYKAYKTIAQRHAFYKFADAYLNTQDKAIKSKWFKAAAIVTQDNAVGAAEGVNLWFLSDNAEEFLKGGNEFLFQYNMKNFSYLMQGSEIPGMEGLRGRELDHRLVEFEQSKVQEFINNYKGNGSIDDITKEINRSFTLPFAPSVVKEVIEENFTSKGKEFSFKDYQDRLVLGKMMVDKLYGKSGHSPASAPAPVPSPGFPPSPPPPQIQKKESEALQNIQPYNFRTISPQASPITIQRQVSSPPPKPTYGTAKTTAPIAKTSESPYNQVLDKLTQEVRLFANAQIILDWVKIHGEKIGQGLKFNLADLLNDPIIVNKIKPKPTSASNLQEILNLMINYGIVSVFPGTSTNEYVVISDTTSFNQGKQQITESKNKLEEKLGKGKKNKEKRLDSLNPLVETDELPMELASGGMGYEDKEKKKPREKQRDIDSTKKLEKIEEAIEEIKNSNEDESKKQEKLTKLEQQRKQATEGVRKAKGYRTFAKEVVDFLKGLGEKNSTWSAGTYPGHSWGEFSVDIFLKTSLEDVTEAEDSQYPGKYWKKNVVIQFFDDLNATAEEKEFAWLGIYNDVRVAQEINKKYGGSRLQRVENHGPDGHKLHIHLDLWSVNLNWTSVKDYKLDGDRIKLK